MNAFALAQSVLGLLPLVIQGISGAIETMVEGKNLVETMRAESRDPTPAEWDDWNAKVAALRSALHTDDPSEPATDI